MNNQISEIINIIKNSKKILVVTHVNPDGDCLGAALALKLVIEKNFNIPVQPVVNGKVPEVYNFLPSVESFRTVSELKETDFDTAISIDCAAKDRMTDAIRLFDKAKETINIDHHKTNPNFGKYNYVLGNLSSSGEVLYNIVKEASIEINKDIANCLYVAILTDTGGFRFDNTKAETFLAVADLMKYGINPSSLYDCCYESKPLPMVKLSACAVSKAEFLHNGRIAYTVITLDDLKKNKALNEHTDGIVELLRQVNSVEVAFIVKETEQGYSKVSLRSKSADVTKIASLYDGGGHSKAAGCTIKKHYQTAVNKLVEETEKLLGIKNV